MFRLHTHTHTRTRTRTHARTYTPIHPHTFTHSHTHTHTHIVHARTRTHTHTHTHTHTCTHTQTHTHNSTHTRARAHTHTHTHKQTNKQKTTSNWRHVDCTRNRSGVCQAYEAGSLKMFDIKSFLSALKISWFKRILHDDGTLLKTLQAMCLLIHSVKQRGGEFANIIMQRVKNHF